MKKYFIHGLAEKPSKMISDHFDVLNVDWNNPKLKIKRADILIGFSMGAIIALDYAKKLKVKTLILCSMTPIVDKIPKLNAKIVFVTGSKEKFVIERNLPIYENYKGKKEWVIVNGAKHKISKEYIKVINKFC